MDGIYAFFEGVYTTHTETKYYAYAVQVLFFKIEGRILYGLNSRSDGKLTVFVKFACFLAVHILGYVKVLDLTSYLDLGLYGVGVKIGNRTGSADTCYGILPEFRDRITYRVDGTESGYDNSFKIHLM